MSSLSRFYAEAERREPDSLTWCLAFLEPVVCSSLSLAGVTSLHDQLVLCTSELVSSMPTQCLPSSDLRSPVSGPSSPVFPVSVSFTEQGPERGPLLI